MDKKMANKVFLLLIVLLAGLLRLLDLSYPLWPDEVFYMEAAKNLLGTKSYSFDSWGPRHVRPLFSLLIGFSNVVFGSSEVSSRIVSPVFGVLGVAATYYLGRLLYTEKVGLLASFFVAINPAHWFLSKKATPDVTLTTLLTLSVVLFYKGMEKGRWWAILAGIFMGLASLTKIAGLILYSVLAVYLIVTSGLHGLKEKRFLTMVAVSFIIQLPWYFRNFQTFGNPFADFTLASSSVSPIAAVIPLAFLAILLYKKAGMMPSLVVLLASALVVIEFLTGMEAVLPLVSWPVAPLVVLGFYGMAKDQKKRDFLLVVAISVFALYSSLWSDNIEMRRYLLPLLPFFAVVGARGLFRFFPGQGVVLPVVLVIFVLNIFMGLALFEKHQEKYSGYDLAGEWINSHAPEDAIIVSNARAIRYYVDVETVIFPESEGDLVTLMGQDKKVYLVVGEWPTHLKYPPYVSSLAQRYPLELVAEFNSAPNPKIRVYEAHYARVSSQMLT
jgi:4-amino-4-deoxy-L-arabinose transferase-like glycosyltransferase